MAARGPLTITPGVGRDTATCEQLARVSSAGNMSCDRRAATCRRRRVEPLDRLDPVWIEPGRLCRRRACSQPCAVYEGLSEATIDGLREQAAAIAAVRAAVPGIGGSELIRTRDGVILVTVGQDEASLVEAGRRFVAWVEAHVRGFRRRA